MVVEAPSTRDPARPPARDLLPPSGLRLSRTISSRCSFSSDPRSHCAFSQPEWRPDRLPGPRRDRSQCMGIGDDLRYAHGISTTSPGNFTWVFWTFFLFLLSESACIHHEKLEGKLCAPPAEAISNKSSDTAEGHGHRLDSAQYGSAPRSHTDFVVPPFQQHSRVNGSVSMVFDMPQMAKKGIDILLNLQDGSRAGEFDLPAANTASAVASYELVGQHRQLGPCQHLAATIPVPEAGQREGQGSQDDSPAPERWWQRQDDDIGGHSASPSHGGTADAASVTYACAAYIGTYHGNASNRCTTKARRIVDGAWQGTCSFARRCCTTLGRSGSAGHAPADQGPTQGRHPAGQSQERAVQGARCQKKFLLLVGLIYGQAFSTFGEAVLGPAEGNRTVCHSGSQMDRKPARGDGQLGASLGRPTGGTFGLRGHGHGEQDQRGRMELRGGRAGSSAAASCAPTGPAAGARGTRRPSRGTLSYAGQKSQRDRGCKAQRSEGNRECSQYDSRFQVDYSAPCLGPRPSPKIWYGPTCSSRVQQWTHSVTSYSDFMSDFEAETCGLVTAFHLHMESCGFGGTGEWADHIEAEETDVNAEWQAVSGQGTSGTYPQQFHLLADMDSSSQFECTLSVGNASGTSTKLGLLPAKSHAADEGIHCTAVPYKLESPHPLAFGHPRKPGCKVRFDSVATYWFPRPSHLRPSASCTFHVHTATVGGVKGGSCRSFRHATYRAQTCTSDQHATDAAAAGRHTEGPRSASGPHECCNFAKKPVAISQAQAPSRTAVSRTSVRPCAAARAEQVALEVPPFVRPVAITQASMPTKAWFTCFGTVEGQQVLQKAHDWTDLQCIAEAIAHAAPALERPSGRILQQPLPGFFTPQVVLTRMPVRSPFGTVVVDLRPIGMEVRTEDTRLSGRIADILQGEGVLAPFARRHGLSVPLLSFAANGNLVSADFALHADVETITVAPAPIPLHPCLPSATLPRTMPEEPDREQEPVPRSIDFSGGTRWSSGSSRDHRVYRPLRPPTPPVPPDATPNVAAIDQAFIGGAQFTVFDVWHHKRHLPRHDGQRILDLVELALSLTPEVRRPWGHRTQQVEWNDMPSPQLVIWGPGDPTQRIVPIRIGSDPVCTVSVPKDACPFQIMVEAEKACPVFKTARIQVARMEATFLVDGRPWRPFDTGAAVNAHIAEIQPLDNPHVPRWGAQGRWNNRIPAELTILQPRSTEDLWPITEVVVHFHNRASSRQPALSEFPCTVQPKLAALCTCCCMSNLLLTHGTIPLTLLTVSLGLLTCAAWLPPHALDTWSFSCRKSLTLRGYSAGYMPQCQSSHLSVQPSWALNPY